MKRFLTFLTAALCTLPLSAQDKPFMDDLYYYLENTSVFETGQEDGRAYHIPEPRMTLNGK